MSSILPFRSPKRRAALDYARVGWHVFPLWWALPDGRCACGQEGCKNVGKHPHPASAHGQNAATTDPAIVAQWWDAVPEANIGVLLAKSGLVAVDIDPRNGGLDTIDQLEARHGPIQSDVMAFTGGGGEHRIFALTEFAQLPGKLGPGVDLKRNGYIVLEPSNHASGRTYEWEASSDPREGASPSPLPDWIRDLATPAAGPAEVSGFAVHGDLMEMMDAARAVPAHERDTWLQVGMAFHSTGLAGAFQAWDGWSKTSPDKYNPRDQIKTWHSFRLRGISGVTKATLFAMAQKHGWVNRGHTTPLEGFVPVSLPLTRKTETAISEGVSVASAGDIPPNRRMDFCVTQTRDIAPDGQRIFRLPGVLGQIQAYYDATAPIPQPLFAVQCALGIGSVALGRHFCTDAGNYSSLYFLNITKSANGKEHIKTTTEKILDAAGMSERIAGDGYTSQAGVISTLKVQPVHISVIDEAGKYLEASKDKTNVNARSANKALMEAISRCGGVMRSANYSRMGPGGKAMDTVTIHCPSITIQAMTTPGTFYANVAQEQIDDGFLGRFVICHSHSERVPARSIRRMPVPDAIIGWFAALRERMAMSGNLSTIDAAEAAPEPIVLHVLPEADEVFRDFSAEMVDLMNDLDREGLSALLGRSAEFARRLGLILSLSRNPMASTVEHADAVMAVDYIRNQASTAIAEIRERMTSSQFEADKRIVLDAIIAAGHRGLTHSEMQRRAPCSRYKERELSEILKMLQLAELVCFVQLNGGQRGRPREAWVSPGLITDDDEV